MFIYIYVIYVTSPFLSLTIYYILYHTEGLSGPENVEGQRSQLQAESHELKKASSFSSLGIKSLISSVPQGWSV